MRHALSSALVTSALALALACPNACAADEPPPSYTTETRGTVPDLVGRWFVVSRISLPQSAQGSVTVPTFWEVTAPDGKLALVVRYVSPPPGIKEAVEAANKESRAWEPTLENLKAVRDAWTALPSEARGVATVETVITGRDAFTDVITSDANMKDAQFLVQITTNFNPGPQRPMKDVLLYGAKEATPDGYRGAYASATVAGAPVPIPITFVGTFRMYRLESLPKPGLIERLFDVFAGCRRKSTS